MKYFLIGDRGISMRGIKKYLDHEGFEVEGSDLKTTGHSGKNITSDIDLVVRSSAINPGSLGWSEVEAAKKFGIEVVKRSEFIGEITKNKKLIAVSGMHGKTTITSMAGLLLINAGFDPTVLVGEEVADFNNDVIRIGKSDWFVLEACEYDRSFLDFYPQILILTNIEEEHLDTYPGGLPEIKKAFLKYINDNVSDDGIIIACQDDPNVVEILKSAKTKARIVYYGFSSFRFNKLTFKLKIPGKHNIQNALAVMALANVLAIPDSIFQETLEKFSGAKRRFEKLGQYRGADIIDDYGHHPTEIRSTIEALNEQYPKKKKYVVFWPHQYKRILPLLDDFSKAFTLADEVIIKPIYLVPGRDEVLKISSMDLVEKINKQKQNAKYLGTDSEIVQYLKANLNKDSVLLTIGIPPVYEIGQAILGKEKYE